MISENVAAFSFSKWYPTFHRITFRSEIIPLSEAAIAYLREDGIRLPAGVDPYTVTSADATVGENDDEIITEHDGVPESDWSSSEEDEEPPEQWVVDLKNAVSDAIRKFGGSVFPKLNWSAPKDACWMLPNRDLKCSTLSDILLVMKSSKFVEYDLSGRIQQKERIPLELVLREWAEINPGSPL